MFKAAPSKKNEIGVDPKVFANRLRTLSTDSEHQMQIAQDKSMMKFLLGHLQNKESSADMLIIVLQTLQFLLSHPANVTLLGETCPQLFLAVTNLSERDESTIHEETPPPSAMASAAASAAYATAQVKKWNTVRELSTDLLNNLAAYTNGDVTPKKPIKKPAAERNRAAAAAAAASAPSTSATGTTGVPAPNVKYLFTLQYEARLKTGMVLKMANRGLIEKALVGLKGVVSLTIDTNEPYYWIVTVYAMAKADALTQLIIDALAPIGIIGAYRNSKDNSASEKSQDSENVPPAGHVTPARHTRHGSNTTAAASTPYPASSFVTPVKATSSSASSSYYSNKVDDEWNDNSRAVVEYGSPQTNSDSPSGAYGDRYSLQARRQREQQQKQQQASKSSVFGFFSSVTSYFF